MSTDKTERAAFEAWAKQYGRIFLDRQPHGNYMHAFTQEAWVGWQARAALPSQPATVVQLPHGWVPLNIEYESGYPEEVAYGPQIMMDRLKKWLERYFALLAASQNHPSAPAESGWQPIASAPDGVRVLLGPREAPVVGIVRQMPEWADEQEPVASVIHYNGTVLVAGYHCSEWQALPVAPSAAQPSGADGGAS